MKTRTLALVFLLLLAVYLIARFLGKDRERSFDLNVVQVDTAGITSLVLMPKAEEGRKIILDKNGDSWTAAMEGKQVNVPDQKIQGLLANLTEIRAQRIVSKSNEQWAQYEVDTSGTRVQAFNGKKEVTDFYIGGFKFDQARRSASCYLRPADEESVYLIDGFVAMTFNQGFNSYRDKQILKVDPEQLSEVSLLPEGEQKQSIVRVDGQWFYAGMEPIDSARAAGYLNGISSMNGTEFADAFTPSGSVPIASLRVSQTDGQSHDVQCYASGDSLKPFVIYGSQNPESYFLSDSSTLYKRMVTDFYGLAIEEITELDQE